MSPYEMGRVSAFLERYRRIEEKSQRRQISREEKDLAAILREASEESLAFLHDLLRGHGYTLATLNSFDIKGISQGCRVYLALRSAGVQPLLLDTDTVVRTMDPGAGKATAAKIWFTQIWLAHLDLLYTQRERAPGERNRWIEATFTRDDLTQAIRSHINGYVRRLHPAHFAGSEVYDVLCAEKGADVERYVRRFLLLMVEGHMLEERGKDVYRQTMLAAVELKETFDSVLAPLMLDTEPQAAPLASLAEGLLTTPAEGADAAGEETP